MKKSPRQEKFILEYLNDLNATKAAERAGYKHPNVQGSQLWDSSESELGEYTAFVLTFPKASTELKTVALSL